MRRGANFLQQCGFCQSGRWLSGNSPGTSSGGEDVKLKVDWLGVKWVTRLHRFEPGRQLGFVRELDCIHNKNYNNASAGLMYRLTNVSEELHEIWSHQERRSLG